MASDIKVVPAKARHIAHLKDRLRKADVQEVWDSGHHTPYQALALSVHGSLMSWAMELDGEPVILWGVAPVGTWLSKTGSPWMLASERLREITMAVARLSRPFVVEMLKPFDRLENYVSHENKLSIGWLRWCGFTIEGPVKYGKEGKLFRPFWMVKEV